MKYYEFSSNIGWSFSRYNTFDRCKRQYYYSYYGKRQDPKVAELAKLESYAIVKGSVVHDVIAQILHHVKINHDYPLDRLSNHLNIMTERYLADVTFAESYYNKDKNDELEVRLRQEIEVPINAFLGSDRFLTLKAQTAAEKATWIIEPGGYGETRVNELKMYAKADFIFQKDDRYIILDWKTGKLETKKYMKQLLGYTTYVCDHFGVSPDVVDAYICHIGDNYSEHSQQFSEFDLSEMAAQVEEQISHMEQYCIYPAENVPKDKSAFPIEQNHLCPYCNFRELCGLVKD
ncbi:MAG: PD-(D/E)XK nuclease family protein [Calditrichaeota bacterium]|jgi:hypothetical protein|nr:PD-(D/E)XK nuclease family protein [Calditrichota bacterium]